MILHTDTRAHTHTGAHTQTRTHARVLTHTLFMSSGHMSSPVLQSFLEAVTIINVTCSKMFKILVNLVAEVIQSLVKKLKRVNMCGQALETSKAKRGCFKKWPNQNTNGKEF